MQSRGGNKEITQVTPFPRSDSCDFLFVQAFIGTKGTPLFPRTKLLE